MRLALVAQLDRAPGFEPGGSGFESLRARQHLIESLPTQLRLNPRQNLSFAVLNASTSTLRSQNLFSSVCEYCTFKEIRIRLTPEPHWVFKYEVPKIFGRYASIFDKLVCFW